ncbi:Josephin domain [Trinorchestia longiramus]|nr:Josephin domain [Trinorchestia longiramus]
MDCIYHEKQEGSLCAVHCLNSLLQASYFSAVDLATIASQMDVEERQRMAELGTDTPEYQDFFKESSNNMDDSGMFSIQVMNVALEVWGLSLTPFTSTVAASAIAAKQDPTSGSAYICNMKEHWFTIRKLGTQWFNLNSLLAYPELLSHTYVSLFLAQLQAQGYCIYIVEGALPRCEADTLLAGLKVTQAVKPPLLSELQEGAAGSSRRHLEEDDIAAAVAASLAHSGGQTSAVEGTGEDTDLENALQFSLTEHLTSVPHAIQEPEGDLEKALRLSMACLDDDGSSPSPAPPPPPASSSVPSTAAASHSAEEDDDDDDEARQLQAALKLSLGEVSTSTR